MDPIEDGQAHYTDDPNQPDPDEPLVRTRSSDYLASGSSQADFESGSQTPVMNHTFANPKCPTTEPSDESDDDDVISEIGPPPRGPFLPRQSSVGDILTFPNVEIRRRDTEPSSGMKGLFYRYKRSVRQLRNRLTRELSARARNLFDSLPPSVQKGVGLLASWTNRFVRGLWDFMNPPLWAMLIAIFVASVPRLQRLFFDEGTFVRNSVTRAIDSNGQVAVPLILVVLGANLARNTLPKQAIDEQDDPKEERNLIIASLLARMLLPTIIMAPIIALLAKFAPVSILDDPIFIVVCFLLTGAPSALQLAQICQINNVFMGAMSRLLFQSYVVWCVIDD